MLLGSRSGVSGRAASPGKAGAEGWGKAKSEGPIPASLPCCEFTPREALSPRAAWGWVTVGSKSAAGTRDLGART